MLEKHAVLMILLVNLASKRKNMFEEEVTFGELVGKKINVIDGLKEGKVDIVFICDTKEVYVAKGKLTSNNINLFITSIKGNISGILDKYIVSAHFSVKNVQYKCLPSNIIIYSHFYTIVVDDGNQLEITWTSISKEEKNTENDHIYFVRMKNVEGRQ